VAAGIVNYDGTHVYALDAATGKIKWQNNATGHMDPVGRTGVSVQGQMLAFDGRLWLAGGNLVSPAAFDLQDGRCLNDPAQHVRRTVNNNVPASESPRGSELHRIGNQVFVSGKPYYSHPQYPVYDWSVTNNTVVSRVGDRDLAWFNRAKLACYPHNESSSPEAFARAWGKTEVAGSTPLWTHPTPNGRALAVGKNAAVVATETEVQAVGLSDGQPLWTQPLPAPPVPWGLALTRDGRVLVTLENGDMVCLR
jgi:outer membrane protein assembly factor BamB